MIDTLHLDKINGISFQATIGVFHDQLRGR